MPRTWASGDNVFLPIGNLVGTGTSANTLVAIAKKASDSAWMTPTAIQPSAGNPTVSMQCSSTNKLSYVSGATDKDTGITWQASDGWSLIAVDKDAGTATPNGHLYVYGTNTWTHSAAGSTVGGNSTDLTGGKVQHGRWATGDPFIGDIAVAGVWKRQLTQAQIEYLAFSLRYWYDAAPDYLVIFDQAATSQNVIDLITGNTEQSHSGASVSSNSVPVFSYGFGIAVPSFVASAGGATVDIDGSLTVTATGTSVAAVDRAASATSTVTVTGTSVAAVDRAASASSTVTATGAGAAAVDRAAAATSTITATLTAAASVDRAASASLTVTATLAAATSTEIAGTSTVTATRAAAAAVDRAAAAASTVTVGLTSAAAVDLAAAATLTATATLTAAAAVDRSATATLTVTATRTAAVEQGAVKATSTATVTAGRTSVAAVTAKRTSTPGVT